MKKIYYQVLLLLFIVGLLVGAEAQPSIVSGYNKWLNNIDLSRSNAFVENKGQFDNDLPSDPKKGIKGVDGKDILFREDESSMQVYFTTKGLVYKLFHPEKLNEEQWEQYAKQNNIKENKEGIDEDEDKTIIKTSLVTMNWSGGNNASVEPEAEEPTDNYFNYGVQGNHAIIGNVKGYKKLIYKNVYPDIDIEYTIDSRTGIKYSYILHPGADVSMIKMLYKGAALKLDGNTNIIINNDNGTITDHAPDTYRGTSPSEGEKISSFFKLSGNNIVSFDLAGGTKITQTTIIDPWTVGSPIPGFNSSPNDIAVDGANNVIICGAATGTGTNMLQKYNSAGVLQWTLNLVTFAGYNDEFQGDVQADNPGNIYTTIGLGITVGAYYNTVCINPAGTGFVWGSATPGTGTSDMYETWSLAFNCTKTALIQSGGGQYPPSNTTADFNMAIYEPLNIGNGAEGPLQMNYNWGEITSTVFGSNGLLYHLTSDSNIGGQAGDQLPSSTGPYDKLVCVNPGTGYSTVFVVPTGFSYSDGEQREPGSVGANHLGVSCQYLYDMNGVTLQQRNMNTGALMNSVTIPGGAITTSLSGGFVNGGMTFDKCGDVYVGSANEVVEFDPNLNQINTFGGLPGTVFDMTTGSNNQIYACGASNSSGSTSFVCEVGAPDCSALTITSVNAGCAVLGSATVSATFCSAPYVYLWSDGQTTSTATGLSAGNYSVVVTGSAQCPSSYSDTANVTITTSGGLTTTLASTNILCNGGTGSATITVSGGTSPYTYSWALSGGTSSSNTALSAGTYTIYVTDANGCTGSEVVTITQPPILTANITSSTNVLCNGGATGSSTVTAGGGTSPYTYSWAPGGQTNANATGLTAGTYSIYVTDANGCTASTTITITQPPPITLTTTQVNVICSTLGSANVTALGGTSPYTYSWSPLAGTSSSISALSVGTYTVVVTDADGCTNSTTVNIIGSGAISISITNTNENCNGGSNATATATASGGTSPYTYSWSPTAQTNSTATGLTAGLYTITITDANGCTGTDTITISQPPPITATTSTTPATCGNSNGSATVVAGGGTAPYTYSWSPVVGTNATISGLSIGTYTVVITDANGCTFTITAVVSQPSSITASITASVNELCNGGTNGSATVSAVGGFTPYTYSWSPTGQTTSTATGLSAGIYTVTTTDSAGCTVVDTITISQPPLLIATMGAPTNVLCNGGTNGSATVNVSGGTSPYVYVWSLIGGSNSTGTGFSAGTYTVNITDANGCTASAVVSITQPAALVPTMGAPTNLLCNGGTNGSATVNVSGGTSPYTYSWASTGGTNATGTGFSAGTYTVYITDANGCSTTDTISITQPTPITAATATTQATCGNSNGSAAVVASGGTSPYTYSWSPAAGTNSIISGLSVGTYTVVITDANGCTFTITAIVNQPSSITASITSSTNVLCFGGTNGSATVSANGGFTPYTYSWSPSGQTNSTATGLSAGTYTSYVTDSAGCVVTNTITITQPSLLAPTMGAPTNVSCFGGNNGSATVSVTGGTSPYNYNWTLSGGTNATGTGLSAGTYTVNITDANGCTASATVVITQPPAFTATTTAINVTCNNGNNGSVAVVISGGTSPYIYSWSPVSSSNAIITALSAGTYTITVTDANGCTASATAIVSEPPALTVTTSGTNINCFGSKNGSASATPAGGSSPYTYAWSPGGGTTSSISNLSAGTYTITITDADNCSVSSSVSIIQPSSPLDLTASGPASVCSGAPAKLTSSATGGSGPYIYSWAPSGASTDTTTAYPVSNTTYTIYVTDANGCTASATVSVIVDAPLSLIVTGDTTACPGQTIYLFVQGSGGDGTYFYKWVPSGQTTQWISFILTKDTTLTIELTDACGSTMITRNINVLVAPTPDVSFNSNPDIGCYPLCIQFRDFSTISTGSIVAWYWSFGNGDTSYAKNPIYCYRDSGTFTVTLTATSANGCSSTLRILDMIKVYPHPVANFIYTPDPVNIMSPLVQFTDESTGVYPVAEWWWRFGDGSGINYDRNPSHLYSDTGTYCVHLEIMDIHGCIDSITKCLDVEPLYTFYIPDAFTPNGDGINDVFQPKGTYIRSYEMYIFDRWGMKLYHTEDFYTGWNGEVNNVGDLCQEDTYVYIIYVFDTQGIKHTYTGRVNLIR